MAFLDLYVIVTLVVIVPLHVCAIKPQQQKKGNGELPLVFEFVFLPCAILTTKLLAIVTTIVAMCDDIMKATMKGKSFPPSLLLLKIG
jgi:hypothetical protein